MVHIDLTPLYSLPCQKTQQMTFIASANGRLAKYHFDPISHKTFEVDCDCCRIVEGIDDLESPDVRGIKYARSHHDVVSNPLICIGITWNEKHPGHGVMDLFVRSDGHVARYQWEEERKGFAIREPIGVFFNRDSNRLSDLKEKQFILDDQIVPSGMGECAVHGLIIVSKPTPQDPEQTYQWNPFREQLDWIDCNCHFKNWSVISTFQSLLAMSLSDQNQIHVVKKDGVLKKMMKMNNGEMAELEPVVVRDLRRAKVRKLDLIEKAEEQYSRIKNQRSYKRTPQLWILFSDNLVADETGRVGPLTSPEAYWDRDTVPAKLNIRIRDRAWNPKGCEFTKLNEICEEGTEGTGEVVDAEITNAETAKQEKEQEIAKDFQKFQEALPKPIAKVDNWDDYDVDSDDENTVKDSDESEESDMDYDEGEDQKKPLAPESVITRDDDSYSMVSESSACGFDVI